MKKVNNMIIRVKKDKNNPYLVLNKTCILDKEISAKAKGIFTYAMCMPDDWTFYVTELINHFSDGESSIRGGLKELEDKGYLVKVRTRDEQGVFSGIEYNFYEVSPHCDFPDVDNPNVDNRALLSNDKKLSNNNTNLDNSVKTEDIVIEKDLIKLFSTLLPFSLIKDYAGLVGYQPIAIHKTNLKRINALAKYAIEKYGSKMPNMPSKHAFKDTFGLNMYLLLDYAKSPQNECITQGFLPYETELAKIFDTVHSKLQQKWRVYISEGGNDLWDIKNDKKVPCISEVDSFDLWLIECCKYNFNKRSK
jgi:hypothetical protein